MEIHVLEHLAIHTKKRTINFWSSLNLCVNTKAARLPDEEKISFQSWVRKSCFKLKSVYLKHKGNTNYIKSENLYF